MKTSMMNFLVGALPMFSVMRLIIVGGSSYPRAEEGKAFVVYTHNWSPPSQGKQVNVTWMFESRIIYEDMKNIYPQDMIALDPPGKGVIILNVTRESQGSFECYKNGLMVLSFYQYVYTKPESPSCTPLIVHSDSSFTTSCTTRKVLPFANCRLFIGSSKVDTIISYDHQPPPDINTLRSVGTTCHIRHHVTEMEEGTHVVTVAMFPGDFRSRNYDPTNDPFADDAYEAANIRISQILRIFPPRTAPKLEVKGSRPDSLLVEKDNVTVTCTVAGGSPPAESVTIICDGREHVTTRGTSANLSWSDISLSDNGTQCVCNASHVTHSYHLTSDVKLNVVFPPITAPKLEVNDSRPDSLLVTCTVTGGSPPVESVTIICEGREPVTVSGTSINLTLPDTSLNTNVSHCVCGASHVTRSYHLTSVVKLNTVVNPSISEDGSSDPATEVVIGICLAATVVIVVIFIVIIVIFNIRRKAKTHLIKQEPKELDTTQDWQQRNLNNGQKQWPPKLHQLKQQYRGKLALPDVDLILPSPYEEIADIDGEDKADNAKKQCRVLPDLPPSGTNIYEIE